MDRTHIVIFLLSFGVCLAGPLTLVKTDQHNAPSVIIPSSPQAKETEMPAVSLQEVHTTKLPTVSPASLPAIAVTIPAKVTPINIEAQNSVPTRISTNMNQASGVHTPQTLPANIKTGVSYKSVVSADLYKNNNMDLHVGTQPVHTLSSHSNIKQNINAKPAVHTPVTLPAQVASSVNAPQNVKPAIHTPVTLPAQVATNNNRGSVNAPQNVKPAVHTPVTLPAQVASSVNAPQNVKPAIHTPVTLPAQVTSSVINAPQNVKPSLHTPVTLPAQIASSVNAPQNVKPAIQTPVTLPAQVTSSVNAPQNVKPALHTPVTLPAQVAATHNRGSVNVLQNVKPALHTPVTLTAQATPNNKDQVNAAVVKPVIHSPVTLLPHLNPDKKTKIQASGITSLDSQASISAPMDQHATISRFSDTSRPSINSGVETIRNKRQYVPIMTLPARIPSGFHSNGGYHNVRPLPAAVRPAGGPIRGSPVYYQQPFAGRF